jgi:hypothetical protein
MQAFALVGALLPHVATRASITLFDQPDAHQCVIRRQWPMVFVVNSQALTHIFSDLQQRRVHTPILGNGHNHFLQGIHQADPTTATGKAAQLFTAVQGKLGFVPNLMRVLGNSPAALEGYLNLRHPDPVA